MSRGKHELQHSETRILFLFNGCLFISLNLPDVTGKFVLQRDKLIGECTALLEMP